MSSRIIAPPLTDLRSIYDKRMPELKEGELLCDACWEVSGDHKAGWMTYNFKHLKQTNICPRCFPHEDERLTNMQFEGL